ncbi:hypothetical protein SAMN05216567_1217 [Variovorax sp. OK605]|nr:hypothetical protein SAMN05216567_1217 [Variovorax sp. OK605]
MSVAFAPVERNDGRERRHRTSQGTRRAAFGTDACEPLRGGARPAPATGRGFERFKALQMPESPRPFLRSSDLNDANARRHEKRYALSSKDLAMWFANAVRAVIGRRAEGFEPFKGQGGVLTFVASIGCFGVQQDCTSEPLHEPRDAWMTCPPILYSCITPGFEPFKPTRTGSSAGPQTCITARTLHPRHLRPALQARPRNSIKWRQYQSWQCRASQGY